MPIASGQKLTAARLNALRPTVYDVACSADVALTGTVADITGASITFSTTTAGAKAICTWVADTDSTNATAAIASVYLSIDGVDQAAPMTIMEQGTANDTRATVAQMSTVTLASAGSHTIKLRGQRVSGTGTVTVKQTHTTLRILVLETV